MLSCVTVTHHSQVVLERLAASLRAHPPAEPWEWVIVDNNSGGEALAEMRRVTDGLPVHIIPLAENVGFGAANNLGVRHALGSALCLLNPDTEVLEGTFAGLGKHWHKRQITSPQLQDSDGNVLETVRRWPTPWGLLGRRLGRGRTAMPTQETRVAWTQGSFWGMGRTVWDELGGFDERFFLFLEDTDLCRRAAERGIDRVYAPQIVARHGRERLSGRGIWDAVRKRTFWWHVRSAGQYFWKWGLW